MFNVLEGTTTQEPLFLRVLKQTLLNTTYHQSYVFFLKIININASTKIPLMFFK